MVQPQGLREAEPGQLHPELEDADAGDSQRARLPRRLDAGLGTFNALQRRGIPSKLLYFPDENHWVLKPQNSLLWHETVLGWLDEWTGVAER